jgi:UDP-3-O-[3-hydroxymyristoyl] glucosamine N-acyltransferase
MAAQTGIAGSTKMGEWCVMAGQVGISGHLKIGNHVTLGPQSGAISSIPDGKTAMGTVPIEDKGWFKVQVLLKKLPDMYRELNALRKELDELKKDKTQ